MATLKLYGNLRKHMYGSALQVSGANIRAVLDTLCNGDLLICDALLENGAIRPHFKITLNGHDINLSQGLDTLVYEHDHIAIFPPIAGG